MSSFLGASLTQPRPRSAPRAPRLSLRPFHEPHICLSRGRERAPSSFLGSSAERLFCLGVASAAVTGLASRSWRGLGGGGGGLQLDMDSGPGREHEPGPRAAGGRVVPPLTLFCQSGPAPTPFHSAASGAGVGTVGTTGQTSFRGARIS